MKGGIRVVFMMVFGLIAALGQNIFTPSSRPRSNNPLYKVYPWQKNITATVFWVGEAPKGANKTPNDKSSWDRNWQKNFGGFDNPDPKARVGFRPKAFTPKQNPFYIALPYNDVAKYNRHKPEANKVIPWFKVFKPRPGRTVLKGTWVQIHHNGKSCFAQWEDCGPWRTDDYQYVFQNKPPKAKQNGGAGIDISPAVRDYLGLKSGEKCHWRFVPFNRIPKGPWSLYGNNNPFVNPKESLKYKILRARS